MKETNREYAEALFQIAAQNGSIEEYSKALTLVKTVLEDNTEYLIFLDSPAVPLSERLDCIDMAFGANLPEHVVSFLKILTENGRIGQLFSCIEEFEELKRFTSNIATATVYSAVELSDPQKEKLCRKLTASLGKTVTANFVVNAALLGGIKIEVDGKILDGSIENHLKRIKGVIGG